MKTVMKIGRGFWKSVIGAGVSVFSEGKLVANFCNRKGCKMKKLFMGLAIVIFSAFGLSDALAATVEVLVVAGGGGGGTLNGGGGGAGGYYYISSYAITTGAYTVTIGGGGAGSTSSFARGTNGQASVFGIISVDGGGGGGSNPSTDNPVSGGANGGCGGGAAGSWQSSYKSGGSATAGHRGGNSVNAYDSGGGGGAGAQGGDVSGSAIAGHGGVGLSNTMYNGSIIYYAGGGGGVTQSGADYGDGGAGGGGAGGSNGVNGIANTGGGGGGSGAGVQTTGGTGGSGIVIVRYVTTDFGTCTGGAITYTDSNGANPVSNPPYAGGYTVHTFTSDGTFTVVAAPTPTPTPTITPTPTPTPTPTKSMDSHGPPSAGSGMYSLSQIYDYVNSGIEATPVPSFQEPGAPPGPTMRTTKEIYDNIHGNLSQCAATAANVDSGVKFFCTVSGSWGVQTGTRSP